MKRAQRTCVITQILTENPNKDYALGYFARLFDCAKSSISEDLKVIREAMDAAGFGYLETTAGAKGGVRYVPYITKENALNALENLRTRLLEPDRFMGGGYLYTTDLMFDPDILAAAAMAFAKRFAASEADCVVTVETKGIGIGLLTARLLNIPLVVIRREARVSDGSTLSINYYSGSADKIQKMSLSKKSIKPGSRAIIIDDFMREGGTLKGMQDMLAEFDCETVGVGALIVAGGEKNKRIEDFFPVMIMTDTKGGYNVEINPDIY